MLELTDPSNDPLLKVDFNLQLDQTFKKCIKERIK